MIWRKIYTLEDLDNYLFRKSIVNLLGIKIIEIGDDYLRASMPVNERTHQVHGILHGGATAVLVETVGSFASMMCIDLETQYSVGSVINVNHLRPIKAGEVIATCTAVHVGKQKHVWDVRVTDESNGKLIAKGELTCAVVEGALR
jgi:1,4-dihydroxy-2-naphthoyl-CoA hydrolase